MLPLELLYYIVINGDDVFKIFTVICIKTESNDTHWNMKVGTLEFLWMYRSEENMDLLRCTVVPFWNICLACVRFMVPSTETHQKVFKGEIISSKF